MWLETRFYVPVCFQRDVIRNLCLTLSDRTWQIWRMNKRHSCRRYCVHSRVLTLVQMMCLCLQECFAMSCWCLSRLCDRCVYHHVISLSPGLFCSPSRGKWLIWGGVLQESKWKWWISLPAACLTSSLSSPISSGWFYDTFWCRWWRGSLRL